MLGAAANGRSVMGVLQRARRLGVVKVVSGKKSETTAHAGTEVPGGLRWWLAVPGQIGAVCLIPQLGGHAQA